MKFTSTLVLVLVVCVVAMEAARAKSSDKMERRRMRKEKKALKEGCTKGTTYTTCDAATNQMNVTFESCKASKTPKTKSMNCTSTKEFTIDSCEVTAVFDFTACGVSSDTAQNATLTVTKTGDCTGQDKIMAGTHSSACAESKPWNEFPAIMKPIKKTLKKFMKKGKKEGKGKGKGGMKKKFNAKKQARKEARKAKKEAAAGAV